MRDDEVRQAQRQAIANYRLALGLELRSRRTASRYGFAELSRLAGIPTETLRSYEKGTNQPDLVRLAQLAHIYGTSALELLASTAEYIYRANGDPIPDPRIVSADKIMLRATLLYCGVTPDQLQIVESSPSPGRQGNVWAEY